MKRLSLCLCVFNLFWGQLLCSGTVNISYLRSLLDNVNYVPTDTNTLFTVEGIVVTFTNMSTATNTLFYLQDSTAGIAVFMEDGSVRPKAGDKVRVTGPIIGFSGLLEFYISQHYCPVRFGVTGRLFR